MSIVNSINENKLKALVVLERERGGRKYLKIKAEVLTVTAECFVVRVATPYGGFEKAPRGITFKVPEIDLNPPRYSELQDPTAKRPTFNRTAQGWISDGVPLILPTIPMEPLEIPESDDL